MKSIGINELVEQEKGPVWVINCSNEIYQTGADVFVTFLNNGQSSIMVIPRTWLPIEVTQRVPRKVVVESSYFVDALSKGLLRAIPAEVAAKLLKEPGADKEAKRLKDQEDAIKAATAARGIGKNVMISTGDMDRDQEIQEEHDKKSKNFIKAAGKMDSPGSVNFGEDDEAEEDPISANFKAWVTRVNEIEDSDEARNEVRMRGAMDIAEAEYLMKNVVHQNISDFIAKKLKRMSESA